MRHFSSRNMLIGYRLLILGGNFRGVHHFWDDPYLNSTTVLFNNLHAYSIRAYVTALLEYIPDWSIKIIILIFLKESILYGIQKTQSK